MLFVSQNPDLSIRRESSSGGIFSILASHFLKEGGTVYGAAFDDKFQVSHIRIESEDQLNRLKGSKYVFSQISHILPLVKEDLNNGRKVLFSGVPCHIATLRKFLKDHSRSDNLLCVEVICHGSPKPQFWTEYLNELCQENEILSLSEIKSINFRDKTNGWKNYNFRLETIDKTITEPYQQNLYMRLFLRDYILREACFRCKFKGEASKADITLGDLWGSQEICKELDDDTGLSLVQTHTPIGEKYAAILPYKKELVIEEIVKYNPSLIFNVRKPKRYKSFNRRYKNTNNKRREMELVLSRSLKDKLKVYVRYFLKTLFKTK